MLMTITITAKNSLRLRLQSLLHKLRILNLKAEATLDNSSKKCINVILTWWDKFFVYQFYLQKGFPGGSDGKESACNAGDPGSTLGSGRSLEKEIATHCIILDWRIPWTEEPGGLQFMRSQKIRTGLSN